METPQSGDCFAIHKLEDSLLSVGPFDELRTAFFVLKLEKVLVSHSRGTKLDHVNS